MTDIRAQCEAAYKKKVLGSLTDKMRVVAEDTATGIGLATPVDTGRARANWMVAVNRVDASITDNTTLPDFVALVRGETAGLKETDVINISNNLPYIVRLNEGHSKQAPASFVQKAVMIAKSRAKRVKA